MKNSLPSFCYVVGLGVSGLSTAKWLKKNNLLLGVWDDSLQKRQEAKNFGLPLLTPNKAFSHHHNQKPDAVILSPGIPHAYPKPHKIANLAKSNNCEIIGDIELFFRAYPKAKIIGITGTNGKSTVTALLHKTLDYCDVSSFIGGNFGTPCFDLPEIKKFNPEKSWLIFELSSFQIELSPSLKPQIMILLNIAPDHLDRYASFSNYASVKWEVFKRLRPNSFSLIGPSTAYTPTFPLLSNTIHFTEKMLPFPLKDCPSLQGKHNKENATAVYLTAAHLKLPKDKIFQAFKTFTGLPHRQEKIISSENIKIINDSKATSFSAAAQAISNHSNIHWLVGGIAKNDDILQCSPYFDNLNHIYFFGRDGEFLKTTLKNKCRASVFNTLEDATLSAIKNMKKEPLPSTLLLSPGCASFDQFRNFEHRGDFFKNLIHSLQRNNEI